MDGDGPDLRKTGPISGVKADGLTSIHEEGANRHGGMKGLGRQAEGWQRGVWGNVLTNAIK